MTDNRSSEEIAVFITSSGEEEAARIAGYLVGEKLAACVNIIAGIRSVYAWQGKTMDEAEALMIVKTRRSLFNSLKDRVKQLHSYEVPEIIALPIVEGSEDYLKWIRESTLK